MLQRLKAGILRAYIHFTATRGWRGHYPHNPWSELPLPGAAGPINSRMYSHEQGADRPLLLYFHGGGWALGDLEAYHGLCQRLAA